MRDSQSYGLKILAIGFTVVLILVAASLIANAQSQPRQPSVNDPLPALLTEVHALRIAMERSVSITPRLQLAQARLNIEEPRITQLSQQLDQVRRQILDTTLELQKMTADMTANEQAILAEKDEARRLAFGMEQKELK